LGSQAFGLAKELGDTSTQINLLLTLRSSYGIDDFRKSDERLQEALELCQERQDKLTELRLLEATGEVMEREGDYYRFLTEIHQQRLKITREIGYRFEEGLAQLFCAQIQGLYLGDYENAWN